jgi:protein TIF31
MLIALHFIKPKEPYTIRDVRLHVRHINDLIHSIDPLDQYNGTSCNSLTFLNDMVGTEGDSRRTGTTAAGAQTKTDDLSVPEFVLPNQKETPITPLHLNGIKQRPPSCLKQLTFSGWNPPIGKRKMKGDLMYLNVITNEDKRYHITASTKGFYVNQ